MIYAAPLLMFGTNIANIMPIGFGLIRKETSTLNEIKQNKGFRSWQ